MNYMDNLSYVRHYLKQKLTRAIPFWTSRNPQKPENPSFLFSRFFSLSIEEEEEMEAILVDCVNHSLRHFMHRNAIFMCERLCAEFPSEVSQKAPIFFLTSTHFVWSLRNRKKIEGIIFYRLQTQCL